MLDAVKPGDRVSVSFRIRGSEYKERYYVDLQAFKIDNLTETGASMSYEEVAPLSPPDDIVPPF